MVPEAGYPLELIPPVPAAAPPQRRPAQGARPGCAARSRRRSAVLDRVRPDVVVGYGGYVSVPAYLAARRRQLPLVVHEQNALPGLANKVGARLADRVAVSFPDTPLPHAEYVGLPIRRMISTARPRRAARPRPARSSASTPTVPTLLVTGGSQGARRLNRAVSGGRPGARRRRRPGAARRRARRARPRPSATGVPYVVLRLRATGWTSPTPPPTWWSAAPAPPAVTEAAAVGLPAVFVPLPIGNGEQDHNARPVVDAGGGAAGRRTPP